MTSIDGFVHVPEGEVTGLYRAVRAPDELTLTDPKRLIHGGSALLVDEKGT